VVAAKGDDMEDLGRVPAEPVGRGENLFPAGQVHGEVRWFLTPADVVSAPQEELARLVAFVHQGGMTFLSPILNEVRAVVCTAGSLESHLAMLAREFEVPCVMAARLDVGLEDGDEVVLDLDASAGRIGRVPGKRWTSTARYHQEVSTP
jgi:phosphoenolpyruvate-protein kinase (PTS system EI component)